MKDGEVQQFGTPAEIYNSPANIFVADFMGSPAMNLIPATIGGERRCAVASCSQRGGRADLAAARRTRRQALPAMPGQAGDLRHPPGGADRSRRRRPQRASIADGRLP